VHIMVFGLFRPKISDLSRVHGKRWEDIKVLIDPDFYRQPKAYDALGVCPPGKRISKIKGPWQN